ncbi:hypothetical protein IGJ48_002160 [Enterococcus pernyi]
MTDFEDNYNIYVNLEQSAYTERPKPFLMKYFWKKTVLN